jgi:hypothetical protein
LAVAIAGAAPLSVLLAFGFKDLARFAVVNTFVEWEPKAIDSELDKLRAAFSSSW